MICKDCEYKRFYDGQITLARRARVLCKHPDQDYIEKYCKENRIGKMPGFICYTIIDTLELPIKSSPRWCPLKRKDKEEINE